MFNFIQLNAHERKMIFLSSLGGALEFYDFIIYAVFAPIISEIFFPATDKFSSLISTYAVFAIGYLIRPIGGILFSHFGDKYGRKTTFITSVMLMAVPTFLIGLLPTNQQIGGLASILLITLRSLQGLSVGGEIPGALTFTCEHVNPAYRGFTCGIIIAFFNFGIIFGSLISLLLNTCLTHNQLLTWGWRIPFILGGLLGLFSFYLRRQMAESPLFISFQTTVQNAKLPLLIACRDYWRQILQGIGLTWLGTVVINLLFLYLPTYLTTILTYPTQQVSIFNTINLLFYSLLLIGVNLLSDNIGRRKILAIGSLGFILLAHLIFTRFAQHNTPDLITGLLIVSLLSSCTIFPCVLVELFPTSVRYTGIAISYNLGFAIFGGLTPLVATYLIKITNNIISPSFYLMVSAMFCLLATLTLQSKHRQELA